MLFVPGVSHLLARGGQTKEETRCGHAQCTLKDGRVMIAGGCNSNGVCRKVDIWDPDTNTWSKARPMHKARRNHTLHVLPSGKVVVIDHAVGGGHPSPEMYDPKSNRWKRLDFGSKIHPTVYVTTLLRDGRIMMVQAWLNVAMHSYIVDAEANLVTTTAGHNSLMSLELLTTVPDGRVLAVLVDNSCLLYNVTADAWTRTTSAPKGTLGAGSRAVCLHNGNILVAGRYTNVIFDPRVEAWWTTLRIGINISAQGISALPDGTLVMTGGFRNDLHTRLGSVSIFVMGGWTARRHHLWPKEHRQRLTAAMAAMVIKKIPIDVALMIISESSFAF